VAAAGVAEPATNGLGGELTKTLVVDGVETTLNLNANTLDALAKAISGSGTGLSANVVNVSSTSTPSYKLVLQGGKLGAQSIALKDGDAAGDDLLEVTALTEGGNARYKVNGVSVSAESRSVTLAPDISVTFSATTASGPIDLSVKRSASQIIDRLRNVTAAYNAAAGKLDEHRGQSRGVLQGQSVISTLSKVLRDLPGYSANAGAFQNFADIGLSFDDKGILSLNAATLAGLSDEKLDQLVAFLGTEKSGGFVGSALGAIGVATTAESGILALEKKSYTERGKAEALQVQQMQERLDLLETNLRERFAALDSAIAALQQQALYFNNLFESMRIAQQTYSK
jgi:flagellar hook-associated protein 2